MSWYVVRTATRQEPRALKSLQEAGFGAYLPQVTRWERLGRLKERSLKRRPLFPGYLFAVIPDGLFFAAEDLDGVHAVLRYTSASGEQRPRSVPDALVATLLQAEAAGEFDNTEPEDPGRPRVGATMRVKSGGWWGHLAQIVGMDGPQRVKVLLALFGRMHEVTLDIAQLEVAC